jgi:AcrR family transcriptional regulator
MARTRAALLDATAECVERYGVRRTTMVDIASRSTVAKATLYNHFRTKDDVLAALVHARVTQLADECTALAQGPDGLVAALAHAATTVAGSRPLARVAVEEPAVLVRLATPGDGRTWQAVRGAVTACLTAGGAPADDASVLVVVRWLSAQLLWPASGEEAARGAQVLAAGLRQAPQGHEDAAGPRA